MVMSAFYMAHKVKKMNADISRDDIGIKLLIVFGALSAAIFGVVYLATNVITISNGKKDNFAYLAFIWQMEGLGFVLPLIMALSNPFLKNKLLKFSILKFSILKSNKIDPLPF